MNRGMILLLYIDSSNPALRKNNSELLRMPGPFNYLNCFQIYCLLIPDFHKPIFPRGQGADTCRPK